MGALVVDWALSVLIAGALVGPDPLAPLLVLLIQNALLVGTAGSTIGHAVAGLRVETVAGAAPGPLRALGRSALLVLVIPALIWDKDQRGLHDKAVGTVLVRRR